MYYLYLILLIHLHNMLYLVFGILYFCIWLLGSQWGPFDVLCWHLQTDIPEKHFKGETGCHFMHFHSCAQSGGFFCNWTCGKRSYHRHSGLVCALNMKYSIEKWQFWNVRMMMMRKRWKAKSMRPIICQGVDRSPQPTLSAAHHYCSSVHCTIYTVYIHILYIVHRILDNVQWTSYIVVQWLYISR